MWFSGVIKRADLIQLKCRQLYCLLNMKKNRLITGLFRGAQIAALRKMGLKELRVLDKSGPLQSEFNPI